MNVPFTKIMAPLCALLVSTGASCALLFLKYHGALPFSFVSAGLALWIGFPGSVLLMLRKLDDDRSRRGYYAYHDVDASREADRWHWVYTASAVLVLVCAFVMAFAAVVTLVGSDDRWARIPWQDSKPRTFEESIRISSGCAAICIAGSLFLSYTQKGKGRFVLYAPLSAAAVFALAAAGLWMRGTQ